MFLPEERPIAPMGERSDFAHLRLRELDFGKKHESVIYLEQNKSDFNRLFNNRQNSTFALIRSFQEPSLSFKELLPHVTYFSKDCEKLDTFLKSFDPPKEQTTYLPPRRKVTADTAARLQAVMRRLGYESFRHDQLRAAACALEGDDISVFWPTGAGKSLCFQVPALASRGVTVVISPLISLMIDQASSLQRKLVGASGSADAICEISGRAEARHGRHTLLAAIRGRRPALRIVYTTPESFRRTLDAWKRAAARGMLERIVVDEAHCVIEWGSSFRPDFAKIGVTLREHLPSVPVTAVTGTAAPATRHHIYHLLFAPRRRPHVFSMTSDRPNLSYHVALARSSREKVQILTSLLHGRYADQTGIVYCMYVDEANRLDAELRRSGIRSSAFTSATQAKERVLRAWLCEETRVMVATIAFGMGIDKENVRFVIHMELPKTIEMYGETTGRAGRDGQRAECLLLYSITDVNKRVRLSYSSHGNNPFLRYREVRGFLGMVRFCQDLRTCRRALLAQFYDDPPVTCLDSYSREELGLNADSRLAQASAADRVMGHASNGTFCRMELCDNCLFRIRRELERRVDTAKRRAAERLAALDDAREMHFRAALALETLPDLFRQKLVKGSVRGDAERGITCFTDLRNNIDNSVANAQREYDDARRELDELVRHAHAAQARNSNDLEQLLSFSSSGPHTTLDASVWLREMGTIFSRITAGSASFCAISTFLGRFLSAESAGRFLSAQFAGALLLHAINEDVFCYHPFPAEAAERDLDTQTSETPLCITCGPTFPAVVLSERFLDSLPALRRPRALLTVPTLDFPDQFVASITGRCEENGRVSFRARVFPNAHSATRWTRGALLEKVWLPAEKLQLLGFRGDVPVENGSFFDPDGLPDWTPRRAGSAPETPVPLPKRAPVLVDKEDSDATWSIDNIYGLACTCAPAAAEAATDPVDFATSTLRYLCRYTGYTWDLSSWEPLSSISLDDASAFDTVVLDAIGTLPRLVLWAAQLPAAARARARERLWGGAPCSLPKRHVLSALAATNVFAAASDAAQHPLTILAPRPLLLIGAARGQVFLLHVPEDLSFHRDAPIFLRALHGAALERFLARRGVPARSLFPP
eukprot:gnl/Chilomastix_cuspidata/2623.p1 GENE.gnl/Chilomastix_cuspidata/2623~~gnl/Chilomastix_cuspidata/2623.p1  ORF type:complete len:1109 (+),score=380.48 gnl/Chilomastix_cuspidata/2623:9-3335(+)